MLQYGQGGYDPRYGGADDPRYGGADDPRYGGARDPRYGGHDDPRYGGPGYGGSGYGDGSGVNGEPYGQPGYGADTIPGQQTRTINVNIMASPGGQVPTLTHYPPTLCFCDFHFGTNRSRTVLSTFCLEITSKNVSARALVAVSALFVYCMTKSPRTKTSNVLFVVTEVD